MRLKDFLLKATSLLFHPLIMPIIGVVFYFSKSPRFFPTPLIKSKLVALTILVFVVPVLLYFLLKLTGQVASINLNTAKERIKPLLFNCLIIILILKHILPETEIIELYFFFVGILISNLSCLVLALFKFKASIHMIGVGGVFMFFIGLSIHFSVNINGTLALISIITGAVATSRLHLKAHTTIELIIGCFIGLSPQLIMLNYWL